jgi:hypothetical protein
MPVDPPNITPPTTARVEIDGMLLDPFRVHGKPFTLPGYDGLPFRGPRPDLKENDSEERLPQPGMQVSVNVLDLSKPEDLEYYGRISQLVANGYAQISFEERKFVEEKKGWLVLVRWFMLYSCLPRPVARG